jgi:hypothetical protein
MDTHIADGQVSSDPILRKAMNLPEYRWRNGLRLKMVARLLLLCIFLRVGLSGMEARAQGGGASEYAVKAAFLAKFPQFVKWPAGAGGMTVGVLGDDPFGGALDGLVKVKRSKRVEDLKGCPIIFIAKSERGNLAGILSGLAGTNVLTVGESDGFARQGGVIGFVMDGDKVRFEINAGAAKRAGLSIDLQLSKLAVRAFSS